jgi:hypothetical protein
VVDETWPNYVLSWFVVRVVCSVLFPFFLILVVEDVVGHLFFYPTLVFCYLACTVWWNKNISRKYIYIGKNSSTCGILLY